VRTGGGLAIGKLPEAQVLAAALCAAAAGVQLALQAADLAAQLLHLCIPAVPGLIEALRNGFLEIQPPRCLCVNLNVMGDTVEVA